jgi:hypothetical protein
MQPVRGLLVEAFALVITREERDQLRPGGSPGDQIAD